MQYTTSTVNQCNVNLFFVYKTRYLLKCFQFQVIINNRNRNININFDKFLLIVIWTDSKIYSFNLYLKKRRDHIHGNVSGEKAHDKLLKLILIYTYCNYLFLTNYNQHFVMISFNCSILFERYNLKEYFQKNAY